MPTRLAQSFRRTGSLLAFGLQLGMAVGGMIMQLWLPTTASAEDMSSSEYQVKAAFLYNFSRFTSWPDTDTTQFTLCILGDSPLNGELENLAGKTVHEQLLKVVYPGSPEAAGPCQVVYIAGSYAEQVERALVPLDGKPVLTVSDINGFVDVGGIIGLRTINNKVRFEINIQAASQAGLTISSKLLSLATTIRTGNE